MTFGIGLVSTTAAGAATTKASATTATTTGHDATTAERRRAAVKRAFVHAYRGYSKHAFGHDEIRPVTNRTNDSWGGLGATLVDSLDMLWLLDLKDDFAKAKAHVEALDFAKDYEVSVFETTIRYVGGLLGAHELSGDALFLRRARDLADRLLPAFDARHGALPASKINLKTGEATFHEWTNGAAILAEAGSVQLELCALSARTGDPKYARAGLRAYAALANARVWPGQKAPDGVASLSNVNATDSSSGPAVGGARGARGGLDGLFPAHLDAKTGGRTMDSSVGATGMPGHTVTTGGLSDSFYEYLLKTWLFLHGGGNRGGGAAAAAAAAASAAVPGTSSAASNFSTQRLLPMYAAAADAVLRHMLFRFDGRRAGSVASPAAANASSFALLTELTVSVSNPRGVGEDDYDRYPDDRSFRYYDEGFGGGFGGAQKRKGGARAKKPQAVDDRDLDVYVSRTHKMEHLSCFVPGLLALGALSSGAGAGGTGTGGTGTGGTGTGGTGGTGTGTGGCARRDRRRGGGIAGEDRP